MRLWLLPHGTLDRSVSLQLQASGVLAASVVTASRDRTAKIWDTFTGDCMKTLSGHSTDACTAVFSLSVDGVSDCKDPGHLHQRVHEDLI